MQAKPFESGDVVQFSRDNFFQYKVGHVRREMARVQVKNTEGADQAMAIVKIARVVEIEEKKPVEPEGFAHNKNFRIVVELNALNEILIEDRISLAFRLD